MEVDHYRDTGHVGIKLSFDRVHIVVNPLAGFMVGFDACCTLKFCVEAATYVSVDERDIGAIENGLEKGRVLVADPYGEFIWRVDMGAAVERDVRFTMRVHVGGGQGLPVIEGRIQSLAELWADANHNLDEYIERVVRYRNTSPLFGLVSRLDTKRIFINIDRHGHGSAADKAIFYVLLLRNREINDYLR